MDKKNEISEIVNAMAERRKKEENEIKEIEKRISEDKKKFGELATFDKIFDKILKSLRISLFCMLITTVLLILNLFLYCYRGTSCL